MQIYALYPEIEGGKIAHYRHKIKQFSCADEYGKERGAWSKFIMNVYHTFPAIHLARIQKAKDQLPDPAAQPLEPISGFEKECGLTSQDGGLSRFERVTVSREQIQKAAKHWWTHCGAANNGPEFAETN